MNALLPFLFVLLFVVVLGYGVYSYRQDRKRRRTLAGFAASNGWTYTTEDESFARRWSGTPFGEGDHRLARNILGGTSHGRPFVGFDYAYDTETSGGQTGRERTTHRFAVVSVHLPTWLPDLEVTPTSLLGRAAAAVGIDTGIQLESEDFNRHFHVTARDPKFASDVLTPRTMEAMLRVDGLSWRIEGADLVSWGSGRMEPVVLLARLAALSGVVDGVPGFVWHDNGYDPNVGVQLAPPSEGSTS
jgi:hypothetical protein